MKNKKKEFSSNGADPILLTEEQETQVLENIISTWSPVGLAIRYKKSSFKEIAVIFAKAVAIIEKGG